MEACANCKRTIGELEPVNAWGDSVVCPECHVRLASPGAAASSPASRPVPTPAPADAHLRGETSELPGEQVVWTGRPTWWLLLRSAISAVVACVIAAVLVTVGAFLFWPLILAGLAVGLAALVFIAIKFMSLRSVRYRVTSQRIIVEKGLVGRQIHELELFRVKDTACQQSAMERVLRMGDVEVISTDADTPTVWLLGVSQPLVLKEKIRAMVMESRRHHRVVQMSQ